MIGSKVKAFVHDQNQDSERLHWLPWKGRTEGRREDEKVGITDQERRWRIELYICAPGAERSGHNKKYLADRIS